MEAHRGHASGALDHSDSTASGRDQRCSPMSQQMNFNPQGHPRHAFGYSQSHTQQYSTAEQNNENMDYVQAQRTLSNHTAANPPLAGEHGQLTSSSIQPNTPSYSEIKSHQRHGSCSHDPAVYGNMSGPVMTLPGQAHLSPTAIHHNMEGAVVPGHVQAGDGHMAHAGYYPVPYQGQQQHMSNIGPVTWQSPARQQFMSGAGSGQVFVHGVQARFNSQPPFPAQNPQYVLNQYGDVYYQHQPVYGELSSGSARGTFAPQQHCVGPGGQRIMFTRPPMHIARQHHAPRMPADAQFVYYAPHTGGGGLASQQMSPSWTGSSQMMRSSVPTAQYCSQQAWQQQQRPMVVAYGSPLPRQRMPDYHLSPDHRTSAEFRDNFGGTPRQHLSPSYAGSVHCYRPSSNQRMNNAGMMCAEERYVETGQLQPDGTHGSAVPLPHQDYAPPAAINTTVSTVTVSSSACTSVSSSDSPVLTTTSHPLEHLADGGTSQSRQSSLTITAVSSLSSYNHPGHYVLSTSMNGSWPVPAAREYCDYNAASQYTPCNQHSGQQQHVNPYNCCTSPPRAPYLGSPHCPQFTRCAQPYLPHPGNMHLQGQAAEHPLNDCRNVLPDKVASHHHLEQESSTTATSGTSCVSTGVTCSAPNVSCPAPLIGGNDVSKQSFNDGDNNNADIAGTVTVQSVAGSHHGPLSTLPHPAKDGSSHSSMAARSLNCGAAAALCTGALTQPANAVDSSSAMMPNDAAVATSNDDVLALRIHEGQTEGVVSGASGTELHNCIQVTSSVSCKPSKGPKRSGPRKGTVKMKKKRSSLPLDSSGKFCSVTCADAVKSDAAVECSSTGSAVKTAPATELVDPGCRLTSTCMERAEVVVPYGWRRHVDGSSVVYYRLLLSLLLLVDVELDNVARLFHCAVLHKSAVLKRFVQFYSVKFVVGKWTI